ncbi:hypothetical protein CesoFtcFv8_015329 [Champsocephalus esox]|uniref:Uncharacterized protein n=1 Tax=Champsocephalus esox TaxID=159716 RepID=A0AAN8GV52_9TELE|nr:hypothetical protein CesoFtcFv8_015329 [Champsocephalus esox]
MKNGVEAERADGSEVSSEPELQESFSSESLDQFAEDETQNPNCKLTSAHFPEAEVCDRVILLAQRLYSLEAIITQQDSQIELLHAFHAKSKQPARHYSSVLLEQEKQRNQEKQKEELANLQKQQVQHREVQQRWEKDMERQRVQTESLEAQLRKREEECLMWEGKLNEDRAALDEMKENYQQDLERLRESTRSVDKDKERLNQERRRLEHMLEKYKNMMPGNSNYDDPSQLRSLQSFRGSVVNGGGTLNSNQHVLPTNSNTLEVPPKVPPRRESISPQPTKPELPLHLISTTNQVHKPASLLQQIPTKLAAASKGKEKSFKTKRSHQRTHRAASIDVSQMLPIRVLGNETSSLRAKRTGSPQIRIYQSGAFDPPESVRNKKTSQSFSTQKRSNDDPPPPPPPFPKDIVVAGKEKVIFL